MFRKPVPFIVAWTAVISAVCGLRALADLPTYHVTLLDSMIEQAFPAVQFPSSHARGLNEDGDLVGEAWLNGGQMQGFVYTVEHGVTPLPIPAGWTSAAIRDVTERDDNGEILIVGGGVSSIYVDLAIGEAALWRFSTVTGEVVDMRTIGIPPGFDDSIAVAANNEGTVVGFSGLTGPFTNWAYDVATAALTTFDFPWRVADLNNVGQVCGGSYRGDLFGNYESLAETYEAGDVMPDWAIDNGGISADWHRINDLGWVVGRAGTGISDGAGHFYVAIVRYADPIGWIGMPPISHLSLAGGINGLGDFMVRQGGIYLDDAGQSYPIDGLLAPESQPLVNVSWSDEVNDHRQIAGAQAHAFLLTPLGEMIIPGDVTGDVQVNRDDYCAWVDAPVDLDGDGAVDANDEQWLIDRLLVFGWTIEDCNANGTADHCDILDGISADCDENDVADECQPDCNGDGVPDICEADCNTNGVPDPCDILDNSSMDCNANGIPDECDQGGSVTTTVNVFEPPVVILVNDVYEDDLLVTGVGTIADVDLTLDIDYRIGELTVQLSHAGVTVTILDQPGIEGDEVQGNGQLGYDITVDDEGAGDYLENVGNFGSPFEPIVSPPSYKPDEPLSAFDGLPGEGIWTLTVSTSPMWSPVDTFNDWGLIVTLASTEVNCGCTDHADCADPEGTGARADGCMWWSCVDGACVGTDVVFADLGGPFGACAPDGVADGHDRFHALNCFADTAIGGAGPYECETGPPAAYNVDAGGPFGDCTPDGVCDGNDAFHALSAFDQTASCSCPLDGGPGPEVGGEPAISERASITLWPEADVIRAGTTVEVEVSFDAALVDLRGYQLHVGVSGGNRGHLDLIDMAIHRRKDHVFTGLEPWSAFNVSTAQMVAGLDRPGVATMPRGYLATLTFAASREASGTFVIDLQHGAHDRARRTFLFPTAPGTKIDLVEVTPAIVTVRQPSR